MKTELRCISLEYIFEDKEGSFLDRLFKSVYPSDVYGHIYFTNNNSNAQIKANKLASAGLDVTIFLDMVPGNVQILEVYEKIKESSIENNFRINVVPIFCSEYLIIKAFSDLDVFTSEDDVELCLNKINYLDSELYKIEGRVSKYKTFEKFCKLILRYDTIPCLTSSKKICIENVGFIKNSLNQRFLFEDCLFSQDESVLTANDKAIRVLKSLPAIPSGNSIVKTEEVRDDWILHRQLIDELNEFVKQVKCRESLVDSCEEFMYIK